MKTDMSISAKAHILAPTVMSKAQRDTYNLFFSFICKINLFIKLQN